MPSCATPGTSFCFAIHRESPYTTAEMSVYHFARAFKQSIGMPSHEFILRRRGERADRMLHRTDLPLSEIATAVGFSDQSHFCQTLSTADRYDARRGLLES